MNQNICYTDTKKADSNEERKALLEQYISRMTDLGIVTKQTRRALRDYEELVKATTAGPNKPSKTKKERKS